ncbi:MAG: glycosyltransferase [Bryobacterales bacterium]|nr:glycosyltransferase [Bryobacterales bacterium]
MTLPAPKTLLFFDHPPANWRSPLISAREIFCGPLANNQPDASGRVTLQTPIGPFDAAAHVQPRLSSTDHPELIVVKFDSTGRIQPRNLGAFRCPKVLLVGDTHHQQRPIEAAIRYAQAEPFDFIVLDHTRHHAPWFFAAGLGAKLHWLPALDYGFIPGPFSEDPQHELSFVGQVGPFHPFRCRVFDHVRAANLPLRTFRGSLREAAQIYAASQIVLNVSLNGDLNMRVFEVLAAAGFLLTDELAESSGLPLLFDSGKHLETWRSPEDLVDKARYYLDHPDEALKIRYEGHLELLRHHHPHIKRHEFFDLVFSSRLNPRYALKQPIPAAAPSALPAYQVVQELHRTASSVVIYTPTPAPADLQAFEGLPRLQLRPYSDIASAHPEAATVLYYTTEAEAFLGRFSGNTVLAPTPTSTLEQWGFFSSGPLAWEYRLRDPARFVLQACQTGQFSVVQQRLPHLIGTAATSAGALLLGNCAADAGDNALYSAAVHRAVGLDRLDPDALLALAGIAGACRDLPLTFIALEEAARQAPLPPEILAFQTDLTARLAQAPEIRQYCTAAAQSPFYRPFVAAPSPLRICSLTPIGDTQVLQTLVQALLQLDRFGADFSIELAGAPTDPAAAARVQSALDQSPIRAKVRIAAATTAQDKVRLFARSNLFIDPAPAPTLNDLAAACASGLVPVLPGGNLPSCISDHTNARLYPFGDAAYLASVLHTLATNASAFGPLQTAAQQLAFELTTGSASPEMAANLTRSAETAAAESRWDVAQALATQALNVDPQLAGAHNVLGRALLHFQNAPKALNELRQAATLAADNARFWFEYGSAALQTGAVPESLRALEQALRLEPTSSAALFDYGKANMACRQPQPAATAFEAFLRNEPNSPQGLLWLGFAEKRLGHLSQAYACHRRALGAPAGFAPRHSRDTRHVVFIIQHAPQWPSLQSVYDAFLNTKNWTVTVVAAPYNHSYATSDSERDSVYGFLAANHIKYIRFNEVRDEISSADIVFLQNPYDITRPQGLHTHELLRVTPRLAYVPYGIEIGGGDTNHNYQFNLPLQQLAWAVFARSNRHRSLFDKFCIPGSNHVFVTGHPRMDTLRGLDQLPPDPEFTSFAQGRPIIFWNPQFDVKPDGTGYSTFLQWQSFLPDEFARRQNLAFVIRPHPLFFGALEKRRIWTPAQIQHFLNRAASAGNILIDRRESYLPVFAASAAMISDASSFLLEYAGTGKPLLYLHNPHGPQLNGDGEFVRRHCYTAVTQTGISQFLDLVGEGLDPKAAARRLAYHEFMYTPEEGVGVAIQRLIDERISQEELA